MSYEGPSPLRAAGAPGRLSGRVVGQLGTSEQFLLWALRRRVTDGGVVSPVLVHGFRLAFGLSLLEPALAAFTGFCAAVERSSARDLGLLPLTCPCVSADEELLLALLATPRPAIAALRSRGLLAGPEATASLGEAAARFASLLARLDFGEAEAGGRPH